MSNAQAADWSKRVREVDQLVADGHHKQALQEAGSLLEALLKEIYRQTIDHVSPGDQKLIADSLEKIGKGKPVDDLTLGQIAGLFREARLFDFAERALGKKLPHISTANFNAFIDIRNRAVHKGEQVSPKESQFFAAQLSLFVEELGLGETARVDRRQSTTQGQAKLRPWVEVVSVHTDVLSEKFSEDIFALDLGPLADGNKNVPAVYRDPEHFFRSSYLTKGLRSLLEDVLSRLTGGGGNRVLKLLTPFGGGKSHTLASLFHAARSRKALDVLPEAQGLARPENVRTAVFDGQFFDATKGKEIPGEKFRAQTMWGWIAWTLGGKKGYEIMRTQDEARVAPGADEIITLLAEGPNLILLDEVLQYLISVGGLKIHQTTLRDETLTFLQRLTVAVSNTTNTALVFSLQSSKRESLEYVNLLQTVDHLAARKDQLREPVEGKEVLSVIQRRLLARIPTAEESTPAANAYQEIITQMKRGYAKGAAEEREAEEEGLALRERIRDAYPFHPALIDVMREQWAAIPDFQRTRGALRFLAACLRATKREEKSRAVLGPGDVPISDAEVRLAFFKEVGQQADFQAVLEHDLIGANARARRIDDRRTKESPSETGKRAAFRLATAILMYSFGGLRRDGASGTEFLPPGITEAELLSVCVGPDLDSTTALACLKELKEQCLYLHFDGARYCFKKDPNVTLLIEQESNAVARDERQVEERIREMLEARITGRNAVIWKAKSGEIPDKEPYFLVAYMPLDFGTQAPTGREAAAKEIFENCGGPRKYRNGLGLAVPAAEQIETLRRSVRYLIAIERIREKSKQLNITDEQMSQLKEQAATRTAEAESALLKLYAEVWLPKVTSDGIVIDVVAIGGRPLQTTLNEKKQARVHDRVMELLVDVQRRVFTTVLASKIIELFKLGEGTPPTVGIKTAHLLDGFYSFLGFPRLVESAAIKKAIARGIYDKHFGYFSGAAPALGADGKYEVPSDRVRFNITVGEDEIDMDSGFLMMPQAIPVAVPPPISIDTVTEIFVGTESTVKTSPPNDERIPPPNNEIQKVVAINFSANRDQLFAAWNAIANLADLAGRVNVTVHADSEAGFDRSKLQNGVLEPLKEADLIE
ncbi:MAG TPA: DUF499 domain-containing protein [Candidatus Acidoferrales bacterium]|jgi:hypothetical protein|nr:DUF499 domain-containing protein [Candidatus Acidoferrales bacterium]